ncbi:hypothetical protein QW131_13955 [Roseibium salinum]|nr:hypothetical protein [Roseibium salinum]
MSHDRLFHNHLADLSHKAAQRIERSSGREDDAAGPRQSRHDIRRCRRQAASRYSTDAKKVSSIETYQQTITVSDLHLKTLDMSLERLEDIRRDAKSALDTNDFILQHDGKTQTQSRAKTPAQRGAQHSEHGSRRLLRVRRNGRSHQPYGGDRCHSERC